MPFGGQAHLWRQSGLLPYTIKLVANMTQHGDKIPPLSFPKKIINFSNSKQTPT